MTIRDSIQQLAHAQKSARGVSLYSRLVNRPFGRVLAATSHSLGLSANQVTMVSALVTAAGLAVMIVWPATAWAGVLGALLLVLGFALDSADGQLSRLTGSSSHAGEWLDHVVDAGKMVAVHGAVLVALYRGGTVEPVWFVVPLLFQLVAVVLFAGGTLVPLLRPVSDTPTVETPSTVRALALLPADFGVLCVALALIGWPTTFRWIYLLLLVVNAVILVMLSAKWFGLLQRAGR